jgi:hypothetical protein
LPLFFVWGHLRNWFDVLLGQFFFVWAHLRNSFETCFTFYSFFLGTLEGLLWNLFWHFIFVWSHLKNLLDLPLKTPSFTWQIWKTS